MYTLVSSLGNERDAANLQRLNDLGVTYVLNVTSHLPQHFENHGIRYKRIPASDSGQQNLRQYFEEAGCFIGKLANVFCSCNFCFYTILLWLLFVWC